MPTHCITFKAFQYLFQCLALIYCIQLTEVFTKLKQPTERRLLFSIIRWILKLFDKSIVDLAILLLRYFIALGFLKRLPEFSRLTVPSIKLNNLLNISDHGRLKHKLIGIFKA